MQEEKTDSGSGSGALTRLQPSCHWPALLGRWSRAGSRQAREHLLRRRLSHTVAQRPRFLASGPRHRAATHMAATYPRSGQPGEGAAGGEEGGGGSHDVFHELPLEMTHPFRHILLATQRARGWRDAVNTRTQPSPGTTWEGRVPLHQHGRGPKPVSRTVTAFQRLFFSPLTVSCILSMASREMGRL